MVISIYSRIYWHKYFVTEKIKQNINDRNSAKNNQFLMITLCKGGNGMKKLIIKKQFCSFFLSYTRNIKIVIWILYLNIFEL